MSNIPLCFAFQYLISLSLSHQSLVANFMNQYIFNSDPNLIDNEEENVGWLWLYIGTTGMAWVWGNLGGLVIL